MATPFECRFGVLGNVPSALLPATPITLRDLFGDWYPLEDRFSLDSNQAIHLQPDYRFLNTPFSPALISIDAATLHDTLPRLTQNPPNTVPAPRLGILFANVYHQRDNIFGVMFDTGLVDPDALGSPVSQNPRQGCAVFLQTIRNARPDDTDYKNQVAFDVAHEIGHVFNLQHVSDTDSLCFMNQSSRESIHPDNAYKFIIPEKNSLALCGSDPNVTPGGSPFDAGSAGNQDNPARSTFRQSKILTLNIQMKPCEFWPWEDAQLDLQLIANRRIEVLDQLDPGYKNFEIWIESPTGERRRYRSPLHYCAYPKRLVVEPGQTRTRDIPVFQQAGGYTFRLPGTHKLWVNFFPAPGVKITSNVIEIVIKSGAQITRRNFSRWNESRQLHLLASRLLFFKRGPHSRRELHSLERLAEKYPREHAGATAKYTLGSIYYHQAVRRPKHNKEISIRASSFLRAAEDHSQLSSLRKHKAKSLLAQLQ
jgi:hypothetical protein